ncbi:very long chain fatty acid elongase 1-like [Lasioglossum baleicum]|uniref:very long chain fatty acid elongase 1-like n=1 Tax=Lasioglossum baleicum TaxID=434251 RepID=UPI003FCEBD88
MGIVDLYNYWNEDLDPRTKDLPLIASNYQIPLILILYLYIVLKWGPNYMKDKKPYNLKTFIRCYNVLQVFMNGFIVVRFAQLGVFDEPTKLCILPDYSFDPIPVQISYTLWLGLIIRLVDLTETVTFVLRKKERQVSFLHLYHHVSIILLGWYFTRFYAVQITVIPLVINSIVHMVMYTYYFLSSFGDKAPKILQKVKPLITIMQMIQFVILILYAVVVYLPSCRLPTIVPIHIGNLNIIIYLILFYNFYRTNYKTQQKQKK